MNKKDQSLRAYKTMFTRSQLIGSATYPLLKNKKSKKSTELTRSLRLHILMIHLIMDRFGTGLS